MKFGNIYSFSLVFFQFFLIFLLSLYALTKNINIGHMLLIIMGIILGIWAIFTIKINNFRITPNLPRNAKLIRSGPYKYIRHPMYTSVLIICFAFFLTNIYSITIYLYLLLALVLNLKIVYEEFLLQKAFPEYKNYIKITKKLFPFIY